MLIAQITDLHVRPSHLPLANQIVTLPYLTAAVDVVKTWDPDLVFVSGDLVDLGWDEEYHLVREELDRLSSPYFVIPGNHDDHDAMRSAFADHDYLPSIGPLNWVVDGFPVRLIGLDSVVPDQGYGELSSDTLEWLDETLGAVRKPTIVGLHHPPFPTGLLGMDRIMCRNGEDLGRIIVRHPHVERVLAGHHHRSVQIRWAGTLGQIAPSIAHQVALNFKNSHMADWILEPPAFLLHRWDGAHLITHTVYVGDYGGAQPFVDDPLYRNEA